MLPRRYHTSQDAPINGGRYRALTLLIALLLVPWAALAQTPEQEVDSEIKRVTVFLRGAQVTREAETVISAGTTALTFTGLTSRLNPKSIQLKAEGDFIVLSVVHRNNFFEDTGQTAEAEQLQARKALKQVHPIWYEALAPADRERLWNPRNAGVSFAFKRWYYGERVALEAPSPPPKSEILP